MNIPSLRPGQEGLQQPVLKTEMTGEYRSVSGVKSCKKTPGIASAADQLEHGSKSLVPQQSKSLLDRLVGECFKPNHERTLACLINEMQNNNDLEETGLVNLKLTRALLKESGGALFDPSDLELKKDTDINTLLISYRSLSIICNMLHIRLENIHGDSDEEKQEKEAVLQAITTCESQKNSIAKHEKTKIYARKTLKNSITSVLEEAKLSYIGKKLTNNIKSFIATNSAPRLNLADVIIFSKENSTMEEKSVISEEIADAALRRVKPFDLGYELIVKSWNNSGYNVH